MPRIEDIRRALSEAAILNKRIICLITDERDFVDELFDDATLQLQQLSKTGIAGYRSAVEKGVLVNGLDNFYLKEALRWDDNKADKLEAMRFVCISDFQILFNPALGDFLRIGTKMFLRNFLKYAEKKKVEQDIDLTLLLICTQISELDDLSQDIAVINVPLPDGSDIIKLLSKRASRFVDAQTHVDELEKNARETALRYVGLTKKQIIDAALIMEDEFESGYYMPNTLSAELRQELEDSLGNLLTEIRKDSAQMDNTVTFKNIENTIAGMDGYVQWLERNGESVISPASALRWGALPPKGVLFCGLPGTGKTEAAKYTAEKLKIPLIELRMDNLMHKHVGESEARFKHYRNKVEAMAPCIVLIDEIEKTFAGDNDGDGGSAQVKQHMMQALLDWLQECKKSVFFFATCNSLRGIEKKPELLREGRFSLKFCVFLPSHDALLKMLIIHINNAKQLVLKNGGDMVFGAVGEKNFAENAASGFLNMITEKIENGKNYFYTGANAAQLISLTQSYFRQRNQTRVRAEDYAKAMFECAINGESQPYCHTNFQNVIEFWILARKNLYTDATGGTLFPFDAFKPGDGSGENPSMFELTDEMKREINAHKYNKLLFERISSEIIKIYDLNISDNRNYHRIELF